MDGACDSEGCWSGICMASHQYKGWEVCKAPADLCQASAAKSIEGIHHLYFCRIALGNPREQKDMVGKRQFHCKDFQSAANKQLAAVSSVKNMVV